ncbi:MAG: CobW family GTP-binding protein [Hyphomicrobiaceae bacterium]
MKVPIPLTVLTGFLGSGKTTLLKSLLTKPEMTGTAVIVNEFGDVGLDDALIESANEETVLLPSGCVCCAVRGDLVEALNRLYQQMCDDKIPALTRVILETSGLADPAPIAHTLMTEDDLFRLYQLDGIVTTVDTELVESQLDAYYETAKQIAIADRIILTKTDRVDAAAVERIQTRIAELNPSAAIFKVVLGDCETDLLTDLAAFEPAVAKAHATAWLNADQYEPAHDCAGEDCAHPHHHHAHRHSQGITSFSLTFDEPLDGHKLSFAMELLRMTHGDKLLRVKGILNVAGEALPFVVHGVQHVFYPPTTLDAWPSEDRRSRLIFIVRDLTAAAIQEVLAPLLAPAAETAKEAFYTP